MDIFNLSKLAKIAKPRKITDLFQNDQHRVDRFSVSSAGLYLDYSKQNLTDNELEKLLFEVESIGLKDKIEAMFSGEKINNTENRAVLHPILRASPEEKLKVLPDGSSVIETEHRMAELVDNIRQGSLTGIEGDKFTDIVVIGIGGSYYGVKVALSALEKYCDKSIRFHVVANVDGAALQEKLLKLAAKSTAVIVISKTFTTQETLLNATTLKQWVVEQTKTEETINQQWFAVTSNIEKATEFGINPEHILPMWEWIGGRFSIWSAVGLPLALALGMENFYQFKAGAKAIDDHFRNAPFRSNMPVLMALIGIWNRNVLEYSSFAVLPYDHALRAFPGYLQQTDMESNGKSVSIEGKKLSWRTAPILFGQEGTNGQHAFMQLMHQSDEIIPTDFIVCLQGTSPFAHHHKVLVANCFAQSEALMKGKDLVQVQNEMKRQGVLQTEIERLAPHKTMKGNTPSNTLLLEQLTPYTLGALLALYEHKIFVQGAMWNLNPYDQWGVELGKELGKEILKVMGKGKSSELSKSSQSLISKFMDFEQSNTNN